jgi:hypothetical protein
MRQNVAEISPYAAFKFQLFWALQAQVLEFERM